MSEYDRTVWSAVAAWWVAVGMLFLIGVLILAGRPH
jgi:hypothetical protein